jgi:hypothetical protein
MNISIAIVEDNHDIRLALEQIIGMTFTSISTPFLYTNLLINTIFIVCCGYLRDGSGVNLVVSTALGIVDTNDGCILALKHKFSLHVFDTQII